MKTFVLGKIRFNNNVPYMLFAQRKNRHFDENLPPVISMFGANDHKDPKVFTFTSKSDALLFRDKQVDYDWQVVEVQ